jgi:hypothetical protein
MTDAIHDPTQPTSSREPSGLARTLGTLSIIFGLLVALADVSELVQGGRIDAGVGHASWPAVVTEALRATAPYTVGRAGMMVLLSIALVAIGVPLRKRREAARRAALIWALVALGALGLRAWMWEAKIWPRIGPAMQEGFTHAVEESAKKRSTSSSTDRAPMPTFAPDRMGAVFGRAMHASEYGTIGLLAIYPLLLLILLRLRSVREGMGDG